MEFSNIRIVLTPHDPYDYCVPLSKTLPIFGSKSIKISAVLGGCSHFTSKTANSRVQTLFLATSNILEFERIPSAMKHDPSLGVEDPIRVIEIAVIRKDYKLYM